MVYFFARQERHGDVKFWVNELCGRQDLVAEAAEIDILRDPVGHDLGRVEAQQHWQRQLHGYRIVVVTPPGCDHSRVRRANNLGPPPSRSTFFPEASLGLQMHKSQTNLLRHCWAPLLQSPVLCARAGGRSIHLPATEHPEDLGRIWNNNHTTFQPARGEHGKPETDSGRMVVRRFPTRQLWLAYTKTDSHDAKRTHLHFLHWANLPRFSSEGLYEGPR